MNQITKFKVCMLLLTMFCNASFAQLFVSTAKLGAGVEQYVSGNWHGTFYSAHLSITKDKNIFFAGPVIQKRSLQFAGIKAGYARALMGDNKFAVDCEGRRVDERFQLNAFVSAQYIKDTPLAYSSIIMEERSNRKLDYNWNSLKLNTAELCMGFELYYKITQNICWKNYFGACTYYHVTYKTGMYHERISPVLVIGTGISIKHF